MKIPGKGTMVGDTKTAGMQLGGTNKVKLERNRSYIANALFMLVIVAMALTINNLSNNVKVIPVVAVMDANGHVIKQQIAVPEVITAQDSWVQGEINKFIKYCNTFDPAWRQHYADLCRLHSTVTVAKQYDYETSPDNPKNPYYEVGPGGRRYPVIRALNKLSNDSYQVSFKSITERPGAEPKTTYYTALVRFAFSGKPLAIEDRWENALGFAASNYRKDEELSMQ